MARLICIYAVSRLCVNAQFRAGYIHDGETVYCWRTRLNDEGKVTESNIIAHASGANCPIRMRFETTKHSVAVYEKINSKWIPEYIGDIGDFKMDELLLGAVKGTDLRTEIVHSNIHSCQFGSGCDPFNSGVNGAPPTPNRYLNFTLSVTPISATFTSDSLQFDRFSIYSLAAHIYLPGKNNTRLDFVTYKKISVIELEIGQDFIHHGKSTFCWNSGNDYRVLLMLPIVMFILFLVAIRFVQLFPRCLSRVDLGHKKSNTIYLEH